MPGRRARSQIDLMPGSQEFLCNLAGREIAPNTGAEYRSLRKRVTSQTVTSQTSFVTSQTHPSRFANVFELFLKRLI